MRRQMQNMMCLLIVGLLFNLTAAQFADAQTAREDERQSISQERALDARIVSGIKATAFEVIIENPQKDEGNRRSYWLLKIGREYLPLVFAEGVGANLVSGSEIEIQEIKNAEVTKYVVTKVSEGYQPRYKADDRGPGGHLLLVPLYENNLDWMSLGVRIADFYRDISKEEYDLTIIDVAEEIPYSGLGCDIVVDFVDQELLEQGFDPETYNHVIYFYSPGRCYNGFASLNDNRSATDLFRVAVTTHEIGHNLGWLHANSEGIEYGNYLSVMGRGFAGYDPSIWPNVNEGEEFFPQESIDIRFPMKPSVNQINQVGWDSILAPSLNHISQDVILEPLSANGDQPNYIKLYESSGYLEYRCASGVDTEAVSVFPNYRNGLFYYNNNGDLVDSDPDSDKHYLKPGQIYNKGHYKISYSHIADCKAMVNIEKDLRVSLSFSGVADELKYFSKMNIAGNFTYNFKIYDMNDYGVLRHSAQISPPYDQPATGTTSLQGFVCDDSGWKNFEIKVATMVNGTLVENDRPGKRRCD